MSELVTNKITPSTGSSDTVTLGDSGDTFTIPSGVTMTNSGTATGFGGGKVLQVLQTVKKVSYHISIKRLILRKLIMGVADGIMKADGKPIYTVKDMKVGLFISNE